MSKYIFSNKCFIILFLCFLITDGKLLAQDDNELQELSFEEFFELIVHRHPVARQAALLPERARSEIRVARGTLDPTINSRYSQKALDGKHYYHLLDNTLRIPTWFGVDFHVGYERNVGTYVNQQLETPHTGLAYGGVAIPLGQGLLIDHRRATIRQARLLPDLAEAEQINMINRILLQAARDYWNWAYYYNRLIFHRQGYELASFRAEAVKQRVIFGDLAAIDSVEANIEAQNRNQMMRESDVLFRNSSLILSNYLWNDDEVPLELADNVVPDMRGSEIINITEDSLQELKNEALRVHPQLRMLDVRLQQLDIERRLRVDRLKPNLTFQYHLLQRPLSLPADDFNANFFTNNYRYGLHFNFPIFLRQERGNLQLTDLRIRETALNLQQSNREIINNIRVAHNDLLVYEELIEVQEEMVNNMRRLRDGEQRRFEAGESSVFLINTREINLINSQVRLQELISRYAIARSTLQWAAGRVF
ncbi:MAG: TolC family protein [Cytophagaceae bacterium]